MIRALEQRDRERIREIVVATKFFTREEVEVAMELVDVVLTQPGQKDYFVAVEEDRGKVRGYVCIGPTPLTAGTFDMYWIVTDPGAQGKGVGKTLSGFAEEEVKKRGGYLLVAETSSQPKYESTRAFYLKAGYEELSRIRDYYKRGDDLIVYGKYL